MSNKIVVIVICCISNTVLCQQANIAETTSIIEFVLCGFENSGPNCINRLINGFSNDLVNARRRLYVEADYELERNLQSRRLTVYELHGYKPSTLMRVLESSFKGVVDMAGDVLTEIWSQPRTSITSRQFDGQGYGSDSVGGLRGKKKKRKRNSHKGMMNVFLILSIIKAKIDLICKIISTKLQIQFAIISTIGLILNIARFWMEYRQSRNNTPYASAPPPQPYNNDQQNASYDDTNKQPGYYPRSMRRRAYQEQENEAQALAHIGYGPY